MEHCFTTSTIMILNFGYHLSKSLGYIFAIGVTLKGALPDDVVSSDIMEIRLGQIMCTLALSLILMGKCSSILQESLM